MGKRSIISKYTNDDIPFDEGYIIITRLVIFGIYNLNFKLFSQVPKKEKQSSWMLKLLS